MVITYIIMNELYLYIIFVNYVRLTSINQNYLGIKLANNPLFFFGIISESPEIRDSEAEFHIFTHNFF